MAAATVAPVMVLIPALVMGGIIGLIELFFVHADERGMGWLGHGLHALPFTMFFVFISMNLSFVFKYLPFMQETPLADLGVRALIAIIAMLKIAGAAAIAGRVGEKFIHTLMIGLLVFAAPYMWLVLAPMMPASLK
jgi:hypothetical protein